jgi:hypothetical protein
MNRPRTFRKRELPRYSSRGQSYVAHGFDSVSVIGGSATVPSLSECLTGRLSARLTKQTTPSRRLHYPRPSFWLVVTLSFLLNSHSTTEVSLQYLVPYVTILHAIF